jgi:hypothetical protein
VSTSQQGWWRQLWRGDDPANAWVLPVAVALIVAQLLFRAWASFGSWWVGDDYIFIARTFGPGGTTLSGLLDDFAGHVMPGDFYVTWLMTKAAPFDYALPAAALLAMQALASLGLLRLLLVGFGRRWGIMPPLVLYAATSFSVESSVWWATGIQALPLQIAFFWAMSCQLTYLQTRRIRSALMALGWVALGLVFYEKTLLVIGALGIVSVAYYTQGTAAERVRQLWHRYRFSVVAALCLGVAYLGLYLHYGLNFAPSEAARTPIGPTAEVMILRGWGPAAVGGPLTWRHDDPQAPISFADPSALFVLFVWVVIVLFLRELVRSRTGSLRALLLPGYFLVCDVLLVVASRASIIGPVIGYEYRYITELSAVTATALAFACMPARGATEPVTVKRPSPFLDRRVPVALACVAVGVLGIFSSATYVATWHRGVQEQKTYMSNLIGDIRDAGPGTPVVDATLPTSVVLPFVAPNNLLSHIFAPIDDHLDYVTTATDHALGLAPDGHLRAFDVFPDRHALPSSNPRCAYRVGAGERTIPLDGTSAFGDEWVKVGYIATADSSIDVTAGGSSHRTSVSSGLHTLYFKAGDERFDSIRLGGLIGEATLCTNDVTVGRATVAEPS